MPAPAALLARIPPGAVQRPRSKPLYQLSLGLVTLFCVLVPVIYAGLVIGVGWLLHGYYTGPAMELERGGIIGRLLVFIVPGFVGVVVILFMLKPFFAPRAKQHPPVQLADNEERQFVAAIHALCRAIGVRPPSAIQLNYQVNAWVQFEHGLRGLLGGRKQLSIGLPLVAGLSSRQLVGVLSHEFGHFAQGAGMRCSFVINTVNRWLESRAYHPDEWDERLERWGEESDNFYVYLLTGTASLGLWVTRLLMRGLFQISFRISRRLSQEMEFDADRYEALVSGSACFRATALQLRALSRAFREADGSNALAWREGKLAADLPAAVKSRLEHLDAAAWTSLADELDGNVETRYWDSHPADQSRIANAERLQAPGLFLDERPASLLFDNFAALSARVTQSYYRDMGLSYSPQQLVDAGEVLELNKLPAAAEAALKRYGNDMLDDCRLLSPEAAGMPEWAGLGWQECIDQLRGMAPDVVPAWQRLRQQDKRRRTLAFWLVLIDQHLEFRMPNGAEPDAAQLRIEYAQLQAPGHADLRLVRRALALFARRIECAMSAMPVDAQAVARQRSKLIQSLHDLSPRREEMSELRCSVDALGRGRGRGGEDEAILEAMYELAHRYHDRCQEWLGRAAGVPVPGSDRDLRQYLLSRCAKVIDAHGDRLAYLRAMSPMDDAVAHLYRENLAELAMLAEAAEKAAGIRPIRLWNPPAGAGS
ncbi:M48 family metallopeptidase [Luteimonas cucumeris]|nr:M48 family metallopeptidase [Luteimonas cucumeris]